MNSKKTVSAVLATALVLSVTSSAAFASNSSKNSADYVYGTMKISYHDFYLGEMLIQQRVLQALIMLMQ